MKKTTIILKKFRIRKSKEMFGADRWLTKNKIEKMRDEDDRF